MTDERKMVAPDPTGYGNQPEGYSGEPSTTGTLTSDTVEITINVKMKLDPEKLRCLQDCGITTTSNVVT